MAGKKPEPANRKPADAKSREQKPSATRSRARKAAPVSTAADAQFTRREEQVLRKLAWGYPIKAIARDLGISVKTVEFHRTAAMKKAELGDRVDMLRLAVARGWMRREP